MYSCLSLTRPLSSRRWPATPGCGRSPATAGSRPCRPTGAAASAADKIAQDFEPGVRYSERRVSLFLGALHADMRRCAAISSTRSSCPAPMASTGAAAVLCFRPRRMSSGLKHSQPAVMAGSRTASEANRTACASSQLTPQPVTRAGHPFGSRSERRAPVGPGARTAARRADIKRKTSPSSALTPPNSVGDRSPNPNNYAALRSIRNGRTCRDLRFGPCQVELACRGSG